MKHMGKWFNLSEPYELYKVELGVLFMALFSNDYGQFMAIPSRVLSGDFMNQITNEASLQIKTTGGH